MLIVMLGFLTAGADAREAASPGRRIATAARQQIGVTTGYDPGYVVLAYPGGDVPPHTGVCSDVLVRALRQVGLDLQKELHTDMQRNFSAYPNKWGLKGPDKNIDHRRVANLMRYFERRRLAQNEDLKDPGTYRPGDLVAWDLGNGVLHIGIVSDRTKGRTPLIIHNIGRGVREEDLLFTYRVIGHYRLEDRPPADDSASGSRPIHSETKRLSSAAGIRH